MYTHRQEVAPMAGPLPLVLVLEDEAAISILLEDELKAAGYRVAGPFATCARALQSLQSETPDMAVLDTILPDGSCRALAAELTRRGVPFVVYSGAFQDHDASPELLNAVWIEKPSAFQTLHEALASLQGQRAPEWE
jgi:DNA-binding response OmpR family regulator